MPILDKIQPKVLSKIQDKIQGILGPELQPNFDMRKGTEGWVGASSTVVSVTDSGFSAILITSASSNGFDFGSLSIPSGLVVGKKYRLSIIARRGAQGSDQTIASSTWGNVPTTALNSNVYETYSFDITATATDGLTRLYANRSVGAIGDELYVRQVSIREIL